VKKLWHGQAGSYYLLFGGELGEPAMLLDMNADIIVLARCLEDGSWWHGKYFHDCFDLAYETWKNEYR
jgi:hypothetical protein